MHPILLGLGILAILCILVSRIRSSLSKQLHAEMQALKEKLVEDWEVTARKQQANTQARMEAFLARLDSVEHTLRMGQPSMEEALSVAPNPPQPSPSDLPVPLHASQAVRQSASPRMDQRASSAAGPQRRSFSRDSPSVIEAVLAALRVSGKAYSHDIPTAASMISDVFKLSPAERNTLMAYCMGNTDESLAGAMNIDVSETQKIRENIIQKIGGPNSASLP